MLSSFYLSITPSKSLYISAPLLVFFTDDIQPPAVNTAVESSQHLIDRETHPLSSGSSIPCDMISHAEEGAIATRNSTPSGASSRLDINKRTLPDNIGVPDDFPLVCVTSLEYAFINDMIA